MSDSQVRKKYKDYTDEQLTSCLREIRNDFTRESASRKYKIPLKTIFNNLKEAEAACNNGNDVLVGTSP